MSNAPSFQVLQNNRDALLLAEVAALLHDMGKCADEHIVNQASDKPQGYSYKYKTAQSHLLPAGLADVHLLGETVSVKDLIEQGMPRAINDASKPWLVRVLGRCHAVAHVEKELGDRDIATKQPKDDTRLSNAFGDEGRAVKGLTGLLQALPFNALPNRASVVHQIRQAFSQALGDTRRPVNEVTLEDWSDAVAGLYKSALAGALLGIKPNNPDDLRWRLLRVNFDVLGLYAKAVKIGDLLGYQRTVDEAYAAVKKLLEEEYPLGNEVYRDSTGIYFTFPDLDLPADLAQEIRRRVEEVEMELAPRIAVTVGDGATATEQLKGILAKARKEALAALAQPFDSQNLNDYWQQQWNTNSTTQMEVCPVCRLRPKRENEDTCQHCATRHQRRVDTWRANPQDTIWINEVADHNGRLALLVGKFDLDNWLSGDLVQTLLVKADPQSNAFTPKNPSPARIRRVWETTQRFWEETVNGEILPGVISQRTRYRIIPNEKQGWQTGPAYNGRIGDKPIDLFRDGESFLTISNLDLLLDGQNLTGNHAAAIKKVLQPGAKIILEDPDNPRRTGTVTIVSAELVTNEFAKYRPWLRLLATPDQFLALVPAAKAPRLIADIRSEYEKQFGKVCNRLPLHLGLVFFDRKMPLQAVLDAGRAILNIPSQAQTWTVNKVNSNGETITLDLEDNGRQIRWRVPLKMGDGQTDDQWYPYAFLETDTEPVNRLRRFQATNPWTKQTGWLVHAGDLKKGDRIWFTPATLDFEYLDSAARRFAIAYNEKGRRHDRPSRPFLLERFALLEDLWENHIHTLTQTQFKQMLATIESARERWFGLDRNSKSHTDEVFHQFVTDTLANAQWNWGNIPEADRKELITASQRGELADLAELHLEILKEKLEGEPR